jgi:hypothetical protein
MNNATWRDLRYPERYGNQARRVAYRFLCILHASSIDIQVKIASQEYDN